MLLFIILIVFLLQLMLDILMCKLNWFITLSTVSVKTNLYFFHLKYRLETMNVNAKMDGLARTVMKK